MGRSRCQTPKPDDTAHNNPRWRRILALTGNSYFSTAGPRTFGIALGRC